jgi:hypothetical protein
MASAGVPAGKSVKKPKVSEQSSPGSAASLNDLPSNARVIKSAKSNLMTGSSQSRGAGGAK